MNSEKNYYNSPQLVSIIKKELNLKRIKIKDLQTDKYKNFRKELTLKLQKTKIEFNNYSIDLMF